MPFFRRKLDVPRNMQELADVLATAVNVTDTLVNEKEASKPTFDQVMLPGRF